MTDTFGDETDEYNLLDDPEAQPSFIQLAFDYATLAVKAYGALDYPHLSPLEQFHANAAVARTHADLAVIDLLARIAFPSLVKEA